ncbi:class I SAM-dependent methyltransferase [Isoptericola chiayiensis]|uniref:class I SAM-dependent methyltransferase n=1 Tax=Isoptericola chiayiensis TaxID=579446 RepID=UPI003CCD823F
MGRPPGVLPSPSRGLRAGDVNSGAGPRGSFVGSGPSPAWRCRWCRGAEGSVVLDLGAQPPADRFPAATDPVEDALFPLRMVLCDRCGLAQLEEDETRADEPRGVEPEALVAQARAAVADLTRAGFVERGARVEEHGSPHGGSWWAPVRDAVPGVVVAGGGPADLVVDSLGLMHEPDLRSAWLRRVREMSAEGVLALHLHPLSTIMRDGTWNVLRHGHYSYLSVTMTVEMARSSELTPVGAWRYPLYGGTWVLAFARSASVRAASVPPEVSSVIERALEDESALGVRDPAAVALLGRGVTASTAALRAWLDGCGDSVVVGYGAASRAVSLFAATGITVRDVRAVVDSSEAKRGLSMPGSGRPRVPIVGPEAFAELRPDHVLLFVPDLLDEVRRAYPQIEAAGARWVLAEPEPFVVPPLSGT